MSVATTEDHPSIVVYSTLLCPYCHRAKALLRKKGVLIIHAPSTCVDFYKDTPQRKLAIDAPFARTPVPLAKTERWGTAWNWPDGKREGVLPIDDSDMGCDCEKKCEIRSPWKRQAAGITVAEADAISDNGQEVWNLLSQRKIDNVILCTGYASRKPETDALEGLGIPVHYAGDVGGPRKFFQAIEEGTLTALRIV